MGARVGQFMIFVSKLKESEESATLEANSVEIIGNLDERTEEKSIF